MKYPWTGRLLWQLNHLLQNFLTTLLVSYPFDNILFQNFVKTDRQTMASLPPTTLPNPPVPVPRPSGRTTNLAAPISRQGRGTPRRSSSRSIKRKKFDDELVESSLKKASKQRVEITGLEKEVKRPMVKFNIRVIHVVVNTYTTKSVIGFFSLILSRNRISFNLRKHLTWHYWFPCKIMFEEWVHKFYTDDMSV